MWYYPLPPAAPATPDLALAAAAVALVCHGVPAPGCRWVPRMVGRIAAALAAGDDLLALAAAAGAIVLNTGDRDPDSGSRSGRTATSG